MARPTEAESLRRIVDRLSVIGKWGYDHLPCDYLVLDVETTGFSSVNNRIASVGFCAVRDCEIVNDIHSDRSANIILKWPHEVFVGAEGAIAIHGIDYTKSQEKGIDPKEAMHILSDALNWARANDMRIVGHNLLKFDMPFLCAEMTRAGIDNRIACDEVVDTHALVKAMQLGMLPGMDESVSDYFNRVVEFRAKGVFSNLETYCTNRFNLCDKYGVNPAEAHDSGYDCWMTHLVVQELNGILEQGLDTPW